MESNKYFVTGVAGTGKTTISRELNKRGVLSLDFPSIPDLCYWRDKKTKEKREWSPGAGKKWLDAHERICDVQKLKNLLGQHAGTVVVTGVASGNEDEIVALFDIKNVLLLQCGSEELLHRLQTRESPWAKDLDEQNAILEWQKEFDPHLIALGVTPLTADGPLNETVGKILQRLLS